MINFPFGTYGKLIILGVPILKHITVGSKVFPQSYIMFPFTLVYSKVPLLKSPFGLPKSGLISEAVLISGIKL